MNRFCTALGFALMTASLNASAAEPAPVEPVDVAVHDAPPPHRLLVVEWNPLPLLTIGKLSANAIIAPGDHHAVVLSPFYAWATTVPIEIADDAGKHTKLPEQKFRGFGAELGYRYYFDRGGPRGFFLGPSLILGSFIATAQNGSETPYLDYGFAADAGYQILLADRVALTLGGGAQYVSPNKTIPDQQFPAWVYANRRLSPRMLFSLGWAL